MNACQKGKRGERAFAKWLRENLGVAARRGRQFSGSPESPDVVGVDGVHFEVKHVEKLNIWQAIDQAIRDCGKSIPVVAMKRNRSEWLLVLRASDLMKTSFLLNNLVEQPSLPTVEGTEKKPRSDSE